jgi:hypothetical protein
MSRLNRRQLLQGVGATLAALGLNQLDLRRKSLEFQSVVARDTPRKLALLVGVNQYTSSLSSLKGCLMDVDLYRELLVYRYGFQPQDILTLTDDTAQKPTRNNLLQAFEEHLIKQAQPGDSVVFAYSGHGSRILDPDPLPGSRNLNGTMVPADARLSTETNDAEVQDIMGRTLFLLMYALQTENVTVILDSCHSGGGTRGNAVYRAIDIDNIVLPPKPSQQELAYQEQWLSRLNLSPQQFQTLRQAGIAKGVGLGSARAEQPSADVDFGDFHAGAFTYLLTQTLWQQTATQPLQSIFANLADRTRKLAKENHIYQDPRYDTKPGSRLDERPLFESNPLTLAAEAVVLPNSRGKEVEFWLGGIAPELLNAIAVYEMIDNRGEVIGEVEQTQRSGLKARGIVKKGEAKPGMLLRELIRGLPPNLSLNLGIDPAFSADRQTIQSALSSETRIKAIALSERMEVDYRIGRMDIRSLQEGRQQNVQQLGEVGSIGLFTAGLFPIEASFGQSTETVLEAIQRLLPQLKGLLANKILGALANGKTSFLNVSVSLRLLDKTSSSASNSSRGAIEKQPILAKRQASARKFKPGDKVVVDIKNNSKEPLYIGLIIISSEGNISVGYPESATIADKLPVLEAGQTISIPKTGAMLIIGPAGFFEIYVIASAQPIREAMLALRQLSDRQQVKSASRGVEIRQEQINTLDILLGDIDRNTRSANSVPQGYRGVDLRQVAAISTIVEVVE